MENFPKSLSVYTLKEWLDNGSEKLIIIDVRENIEIQMASLPFVDIYIPMSEVSFENVSSKISNVQNNKLVILCHRGLRSYNFGKWMLDNKLISEVWNLEDGIEGWSIYIDPNVPRY